MTTSDFDLTATIKRILYFNDQPDPQFQSTSYGLDGPICTWAGLPRMPIPFAMHHYVENRIDAYPVDLATMDPILVSRRKFKDFLLENHKKPAFATGSPYWHHRQQHNISQSPNACGTIAFPGHSTRTINANYNIEQYIGELKALPDAFQPVTVSIFWQDLLKGIHQHYLKAGIPVTCAGHVQDPMFCTNLYNILRQFRFITSNFIYGSSLTLAVDLGLGVFLMGDGISFNCFGDNLNRVKGFVYTQENIADLKKDPDALAYTQALRTYRPDMTPVSTMPSPGLKQLASEFLSDKGADSPALVRDIIFRGFYENHPLGQEARTLVLSSPAILKDRRYEEAFQRNLHALNFCRAIEQHPELADSKPANSPDYLTLAKASITNIKGPT